MINKNLTIQKLGREIEEYKSRISDLEFLLEEERNFILELEANYQDNWDSVGVVINFLKDKPTNRLSNFVYGM